jgi:hypothetical protein
MRVTTKGISLNLHKKKTVESGIIIAQCITLNAQSGTVILCILENVLIVCVCVDMLCRNFMNKKETNMKKGHQKGPTQKLMDV